MCTGLELGLMAAGAAGKVIEANQAQRSQDAMVSASNDRLNQFLDRNQKRADEAAALFAERQKGSQVDEATAARDAAIQGREEKVTQAVDSTAPSAPVPLKGSAESVIGNVYSGEAAKASDAAKTRAKMLAKTSGTTDALFNQDVANTSVGRKIATIGDFSSSDAQMLPLYQDLAMAQERRRPSGIGALLSGIGTAGGYYFGAGSPRIS